MTFRHSTQTIYDFIKTALAGCRKPCYIIYIPIACGGEPTALAGKTLLQAFLPTNVVGVTSPKTFRPIRCSFPKTLGFSSFQPNKTDINSS